jgi:hypothetical protein
LVSEEEEGREEQRGKGRKRLNYPFADHGHSCDGRLEGKKRWEKPRFSLFQLFLSLASLSPIGDRDDERERGKTREEVESSKYVQQQSR